MAFVGSNLIEGDDGGIYQQSNPTNNTGVWSSKIGTGLQISEVYGVAYDRISNVLMGSNQIRGRYNSGSPEVRRTIRFRHHKPGFFNPATAE